MRMIEISADEEWTPFLERVNEMLIEEKKYRHEDDNIKLAEICTKIVSTHIVLLPLIRHSLLSTDSIRLRLE